MSLRCSKQRERYHGDHTMAYVGKQEAFVSRERFARFLAEAGMALIHQAFFSPKMPISLQRTGKVVKALASDRIPKGELAVPLFFKKSSSMVMEDKQGPLHPHTVKIVVGWKEVESTEEGTEKGTDTGKTVFVTVEKSATVFVTPELSLPKKESSTLAFDSTVVEGKLDWSKTDMIHPFWFIRRADSKADSKVNTNMEMILDRVQLLESIVGDQWVNAGIKIPLASDMYIADLPMLVNTKALDPGDEIILEWAEVPKKKAENKERKAKTAFDSLDLPNNKKPKIGKRVSRNN